jgi:hypothetical protein
MTDPKQLEKDLADAEASRKRIDEQLAETEGWDAVDEAAVREFLGKHSE